MIARDTPFQGKLGLYEPANAPVGERLAVRLVVQESVLRFGSYAEAYAFLYQGRNVMHWVYTNDGLVVGYGFQPDRNQVNIDLFQILVDEVKPNGLTGAKDDAVRVG